jgi:hypothetical protein
VTSTWNESSEPLCLGRRTEPVYLSRSIWAAVSEPVYLSRCLILACIPTTHHPETTMSYAKGTHSKMLTTRRRNKRHLKLLAVAAKREKKLRNQGAKAAAPASKE